MSELSVVSLSLRLATLPPRGAPRSPSTGTTPFTPPANTPAHQSEVFSFDDHAPLAFRHLREHFGVSTEDYLLSICGARAS